ncbi:MAG: hypothetical protein ABIC91_00675 [Nanoarchaeota archaeon]|nr:hypothetical protein [Nanoarchaeota archaeon]MBU1029885.1 hypothetical protein [Nanoarchaeota archaeon]MBU1850683.1 hypothetical protein [Nanoarchaeota archaeon]
MNNKILSKISILYIAIVSIIPFVSAANSAFNSVTRILNDFANFLVVNDSWATAAAMYPSKPWLPIFLLFFLVMGIIHAAVTFTPHLSNLFKTKGLKLAVSLPLSLFAIQSALAISLVGGLGPTVMAVIFIIVIVMLMLIIFHSFSAGHSSAAEQAYKAKETKLIAEKSLNTTQDDVKKAKNLIRKENKAIKDFDKLDKTLQSHVNEELKSKLAKILKILKVVQQIGVRDSDTKDKYVQRALNILKTLLPTIKDDFKTLNEMKKIIHKVKKIDLSAWEHMIKDKSLETHLKHLSESRKGSTLSTTQEASLKAITGRLESMYEHKKELETKITSVGNKVQNHLQEFNTLINETISSLEHDNINGALGKVQEGLNIENKQTLELSELHKLSEEIKHLDMSELRMLSDENRIIERILSEPSFS